MSGESINCSSKIGWRVEGHIWRAPRTVLRDGGSAWNFATIDEPEKKSHRVLFVGVARVGVTFDIHPPKLAVFPSWQFDNAWNLKVVIFTSRQWSACDPFNQVPSYATRVQRSVLRGYPPPKRSRKNDAHKRDNKVALKRPAIGTNFEKVRSYGDCTFLHNNSRVPVASTRNWCKVKMQLALTSLME